MQLSKAETAKEMAQGIPSRLWPLLPPLTDIFFIAVFAVAFICAANGWQRLLDDGDTGLHIRVGDYILANHRVPGRDLFLFSRPPGEWYAHEWLSEVTLSLLSRWWGLKGVVLFTGVLYVAVFTILLRFALWRGANSLIALILVLMANNVSSIHLLARPHIFTYLLIVAIMFPIAADRQRRSVAIWLLIPVTVLWTNLHGGFVMIFAVLGLLVAGTAAEACLDPAVRERRIRDTIRYAVLTLACAVASLVNPYGFRLHKHVFEVLTAKWIVEGISEFQSPSFHSSEMVVFMTLLFLGLACVFPLVRKRKIPEVLWILFLGYASLVSVRHAPIFCLIATPIIAVEVSSWWNAWIFTLRPSSVPRLVDDVAAQIGRYFEPVGFFWVTAFVAAIAMTGWIQWPTDISASGSPAAMIGRHREEIAASRILTFDQWGDYLIYRNYPRQRVFIDGRSDYYGERIAHDYSAMRGGQPAWNDLLKKYRFDMVLCPVDWPLASLLRYQPEWRVIDSDAKAVLFRKIPGL